MHHTKCCNDIVAMVCIKQLCCLSSLQPSSCTSALLLMQVVRPSLYDNADIVSLPVAYINLLSMFVALQEIEDAIRDVAEETQSPTLTPNMLITCLKQAHKTIDEATTFALVCRAFGPAWQQNEKQTLGLGAIIKRIRRGSLQQPPAPAVAPTAGKGTPPSGKLRTRLASALKDGPAASSGGPPSANAQRRRSSGNGSAVGPLSSSPGPGAGPSAPPSAVGQQRRRAGASIAAAAGARGGTPTGGAAAGGRAGSESSAATFGEQKGAFGGAVNNALEAVVAARAQHAGDRRASNAASSPSRPSTATLAAQGAAATANAAAATPGGTSPQPLLEAVLRTVSEAGMRPGSAASHTSDGILGSMPLPVLNAMESVRQQWMRQVSSAGVSSTGLDSSAGIASGSRAGSAAGSRSTSPGPGRPGLAVIVDEAGMQRQPSGSGSSQTPSKGILRPGSPSRTGQGKRTSFMGALQQHEQQQERPSSASGIGWRASGDGCTGIQEEADHMNQATDEQNMRKLKSLSKQKSLHRLEAAMLDIAIDMMSPEAAEVLGSAATPDAWSPDEPAF